MTTRGFQAGVGRVSITPPLSAPHAGWGAQVHLYPDGVEADLWATVLVVASESQMVALIEMDLVIISRDEADAIRREVSDCLKISTENVRVAVSHNHAGPPPSSWNWMAEGGGALRGYYSQLPHLVSGAALLAYRNMRPARLAAGNGSSSVAVNRRETAPRGRTVTGVDLNGPIDPDVLMVRIDSVDGDPLAALVGYTMHPTTMGPSSRLLSPDWPGHLKRTVEALTGATCLFMQGATGDIGPGPEGYTDDVRVVRRLGALVGCEAARVYLSLDVPPVKHRHERVWESGAPLGKWTSTPVDTPEPIVSAASAWILLPLKPQPSVEEASAAVDEAQQRLRELTHEGGPAAAIEAATFVVKRANMTLSRAQTFGGQETFPVELHAVRLGPVVIAGVEGEPFSQIGKDIKERSPFTHTWFGGYTGGWFGYIPTPEEYPRQGYEVETSPYTLEAAGRLVSETMQLLGNLVRD